MNQETSSNIGCLVMIAFFVGFVMWMMHGLEEDKSKSSDIIESIKQLSSTDDPDTFFLKLTNNWRELRDVGGIFISSPPKIKKSTSGKFILSINSEIGSALGAPDLGRDAKESCANYIATIAYMCSSKFGLVEKIEVNEKDSDDSVNPQSAIYNVVFYPDTSFVKAIAGNTIPYLDSIVKPKMITIMNTASGKYWKRAPR